MQNNTQALVIFMNILLCGSGVGLFYDVLNNTIFLLIKKKSICDVLFWSITFFIILNVLFNISELSVRVYMLIGFLSGWFIYAKLISSTVKALCEALMKLCANTVKSIYRPINRRFDSFVINNKSSILKIKNVISNIKKLPKNIAIGYNIYIKHPFKEKNHVCKEKQEE